MSSKLEGFRTAMVVYVSPRENENIWSSMLAAVLRQHGADVRFFLLHAFEDNRADVAQRIRQFDPTLVCLAVYDYNNFGVYFENFAVVDAYGPLTTDIKRDCPNTHINASSWFVSLCAEEYLTDHPQVDSVMVGESEQTVIELAERLHAGLTASGCAGMVLREAGKLARTEPRAGIMDLDTLPFMDRDMYQAGTPARVATSRGCHAACEFCSIAYFNPLNEAPRWRGRSPDNVVAELELLSTRYDISMFEFEDGSFEDQDKGTYRDADERMMRICDLILERRLTVLFAVFMRTKTALKLTESQWLRLRAAGLYKIFVGVDAVEGVLRRKYRKPSFELEAVPALHRMLEGLHIEMRIGYILFNPWSTFEGIRDGIEFMRRNSHLCWVQWWSPLELLPGLPIIDRAREDGLLAVDYRYDRPWAYRFADDRIEPLAHAMQRVMKLEPKDVDTKLKRGDIALHRLRRAFEQNGGDGFVLDDFSRSLERHRAAAADRNDEFLHAAIRLAETGWSDEEFEQLRARSYPPLEVVARLDALEVLRDEINAAQGFARV